MTALPSLETVIAKLRDLGIALPGDNVHLDTYGDSEAQSRELIELTCTGQKRAGTSLLWTHERDDEPIPRPGDIAIVLDHRNEPVLVTRPIQVDVVPYCDVTAEYAACEGEGDGSLDYWREVHWAFFSRECVRIGRTVDLSMPLVCCRFEVLTIVPEAASVARMK